MDRLHKGDWVEARGFGGETMRRRVVAVEQGKVYICKDDEYVAAEREGREPVCVGFRPEAVKRA